MYTLPIPGLILYNPTFESYTIETKFQRKYIKKTDWKLQKYLELMSYPRFTISLKSTKFSANNRHYRFYTLQCWEIYYKATKSS